MGRARGHKRKSHREIRTVLVLAALVCVLGAAIVLARGRDPRGLRPPPLSPELQARIESPENAAHVLVQALYLLPGDNPLPQKYPVPDQPGELRLFETESGSIARALDIWAPDDAPEIAARIEQCRPALDKAREAFDAPYFLFPAQDANVRRPMLEILVLHFRIACRHAWEIRGEQETALESLFDGVRVCRLLQQDGTIRFLTTIQEEERSLWTLLGTYLEQSGDAATLNRAFEGMLRLGEPPQPDYAHMIDAEWQAYYAETERIRSEDSSGGFNLRRLLYVRWRTQRLRAFIEHRGEWQECVALPYPRLEKTLDAAPVEMAGELKEYDSLGYQLCVARFAAANCTAAYRQVLLLALLELHRLDQGQYPETLAEAAAGRLETVPEDPFTGTAFQYHPATPERLLVSPGPGKPPQAYRRPETTWRAEVVKGVVSVERINTKE